MAETTRDPLMAPLRSALLGRALGIPNPICYAMSPDRLLACSLRPGHEPPHNSRHDGSGVEWAPPCGPCAEFQAGEREDAMVWDALSVHVCERVPEDDAGWPRVGGSCPCGCQRTP